MGKNNYDWVAEEKQKAMMRKLVQTPQPSWMQPTVAERHGVSYTGLGQNGQLDREAPAGMDVTGERPHVYHEGELRIATPEGRAYINSDIAPIAGGFAGPSTPVLPPTNIDQQDNLRRAEQNGMMGFASGGGLLNTAKNAVLQAAQTAQDKLSTLFKTPSSNTPAQTTPLNAGNASPVSNTQQPQTPNPIVNTNQTSAAPTPSVGVQQSQAQPQNQPVQPANIQYQRDAEGQYRVDDMRREAAAERSFLEHQQTMRGTDANAAWAQQAMTKARQDENINSFAAKYAQGADERNFNKLTQAYQTALAAGDINSTESIFKQMHPGAEIDHTLFRSDIERAKFYQNYSELEMCVTKGMSADETINLLRQSGALDALGGEQAVRKLYQSENVNVFDRMYSEIAGSQFFNSLPKEAQDAYVRAYNDMVTASLLGDGAFEFTVVDASGNIVGTYEFKDMEKAYSAANSAGGSVQCNFIPAKKESDNISANVGGESETDAALKQAQQEAAQKQMEDYAKQAVNQQMQNQLNQQMINQNVINPPKIDIPIPKIDIPIPKIDLPKIDIPTWSW